MMTMERSDYCYWCGQTVTLAEDGAWNDASGACGCGDWEHEPGGDGVDRIAENDLQDPRSEPLRSWTWPTHLPPD
jgi:hypothetical protein